MKIKHNVFQELEQLIPPPGHFILTNATEDIEDLQKTKSILNVSERPAKAKKVYKMYKSSWNNGIALLEEAQILLKNSRYARAVVLAISAWEEFGKSQIAADYYSGVISEEIYLKAFKDHKLKGSYLVRMGLLSPGKKRGVISNSIIGQKLETIRQNALYVSENNEPSVFGEEEAEFVVKRVEEHREYITWAEEFNGRIGSKALFK